MLQYIIYLTAFIVHHNATRICRDEWLIHHGQLAEEIGDPSPLDFDVSGTFTQHWCKFVLLGDLITWVEWSYLRQVYYILYVDIYIFIYNHISTQLTQQTFLPTSRKSRCCSPFPLPSFLPRLRFLSGQSPAKVRHLRPPIAQFIGKIHPRSLT